MTGRLPFDPDRIKRGKRAGPGGEQPPGSVASRRNADDEQVWTVSQLAARIDTAIKVGVPGRVRVVGEISNISNRTHWYFSLKDEGAVISAVLFASTAKRCSVSPAQGDRVIAHGRLDFYAPSGRISLIIDQLEPVGQGSLERELRARVDLLRERGWLDPAAKSPLPDMPRRIAVITSKEGAAVHDVIDTSRRRCPMIGLLLIDVRVQGSHAAQEVAEAIRLTSDHAEDLGVDAILVTRGGGSLEDLWAFNEMVVAEAIHDANIPVVAAIGHETDVTVAELVADERAATPTQAAMRLIPDAVALEEQLAAIQNTMRAEVRAGVRNAREILAQIARRPALRDPSRGVAVHGARLESVTKSLVAAMRERLRHAERRLHRASASIERARPAAVHARREEALRGISARLERALRARLAQAQNGLDALHRELHAVGPQQVLARGYSVTTLPDGTLIREPSQAPEGGELLTRLAGGRLRSRVIGESGQPPVPTVARTDPAPPPPRRGRAKAASDRSQMDLF